MGDPARLSADSDGAAPGALPRRLRLNYLGLVLALVGIMLALTPSLLPRPWLFEGVIAGVGAAVGYGLGVLASWLLRRPGRREPGREVKRVAWRVLAVAGPLLLAAAITVGALGQNEVRRLVGEPEIPGINILGITAGTLAVGLALVACARGVRRLTHRLHWHFGRVLPRRVAWALAVVVVALVGYWLAAGVLFNAFVSVADAVYAQKNEGTPQGVDPPTAASRSGSPESLVPWESLGYEGRAFVGRGPTTEQIADLTGEEALEPIRVYVGVDSAPSAEQRAALAVQELERTGAFERSVLVVAGATGTGWLDAASIDAVEYLWGGGTAVAAIQYSYLPSWISVLVDQERARDAGRALFEAVHARWSALPESSRPLLVPYGLSLGSFAAQAPFSGVQDLVARTDGALFVGTPSFTEPWATITRTRDEGSPQWQPVHEGGVTARFAASEPDLGLPPGPWSRPRVLYLQHASDPVVWWSPDLLSRRPDWLVEPRGPDVTPATRWIPLITFLQVTVDEFFGVEVPAGHGHNYSDMIVPAWEAVVPPPDWTAEESRRLRALVQG